MLVLHLIDAAQRRVSRRLDGPIPLDHPSMPAAVVVPDGDAALVCDAAQRVLGRVAPGGSLRLGPLRLRVDREARGDTEPLVTVGDHGPLALRVDATRVIPLEGAPVVVGRAFECDLVLDDPTVSGRHCELLRADGRWVARDLGSTNGLRVAGARVREAGLAAGVSLGIGRLTLRVESRAARGDDDDPIVGDTEPVRRLRADIARLAPAPYPVLVQGESGVGKELVARSLHERSPRARGPFVAVNCGALSPEVIESELFGHERGAFTGAVGRRRGLFEEASGGTLLLDEVGELPLSLQTRLLRTLETGEVRRVGAEGVQRVDVRVVAATWRDLDAMAHYGTFRHDLLYRLAVLRLRVAPLRERAADIPALAEALLARVHRETGRRCALEDRALARMLLHPWPGNVRELLSVLKRAVFLCDGDVIGARHVELAAAGYAAAPPRPRRVTDRAAAASDDGLRALMSQFDGNLTRVAKVTGLARSTVRARLARGELPGRRDTGTPGRYDPPR